MVPTGSDFAPYPEGTIGTPIRAIADGRVLKVWDNDSVRGYHQALLIEYPDLEVDVLYGHVGRGTMLPVGTRFGVWDVIAKTGTRYDSLGADIHAHVQVAHKRDRAKTLQLGAAFNAIAIDPRPVRLRAGEPDMPDIQYFGPTGPKSAAVAITHRGPNLACGDHS